MNSHENLDIIGCPECGAPAEITDRFTLPSTDGPVEFLKVQCVSRRWFTVPAERTPVAPLVRALPQLGAVPFETVPVETILPFRKRPGR